ncbi:hypothetical protein [Sphingomicrobium clamense]|uniref:DUF4402 domain-containing protein n=1 Tax=Sphingomicrobium clamense TaxID=2851013 RepID=A0ABS6V4J6_9SPHN|nr:hypothetical protein [Sphingomicrobium sp. B8]
MPIGSLTSRAHFVTDRPGLSFVYIRYDPTVTMTPVDGVGDPIVVNLEFAMTNRIFGWNSGAGQYALVAGPEQNYYIGGSFALPATQVDGAYEGTFEFIVDNP